MRPLKSRRQREPSFMRFRRARWCKCFSSTKAFPGRRSFKMNPSTAHSARTTTRYAARPRTFGRTIQNNARKTNMPAFWMCEVAPTEVAGSDAFNRNQLLCREALTHDRAHNVQRAAGARRALRVLFVDDDHDTTDGLANLVRRWGHAVRG